MNPTNAHNFVPNLLVQSTLSFHQQQPQPRLQLPPYTPMPAILIQATLQRQAALQMQPAFQMQQAVPNPAQMPGHNQNEHNNDEESEEEVEEDDEPLRSIFCGNLDENVTEELLYEIFINAGPLENVKIPKDNNGRQRNFGFVTYKHQCAVPYALELYRGLTLYGKSITLKAQGSLNQTPNNDQQPERYSMPNKEGQDKRSGAGKAPPGHSFDNAALRGFNGGNDMPPGTFDFSQGVNPFKINDAVPDQTSLHRGDDKRPDKRHSGGKQ